MEENEVMNETAAAAKETAEPVSDVPAEDTDVTVAETVVISAEELAELREENARFRAEAAKLKRLESESEELKLLFPDADTEALPDEVKENWENGMLLAAAYALWDKRRLLAEANADTANRINAEASPGPIENDGSGDGSFTIEDIRRMPRSEVRNYLDRIYRSLEKHGKKK